MVNNKQERELLCTENMYEVSPICIQYICEQGARCLKILFDYVSNRSLFSLVHSINKSKDVRQ